MTNKQLDCVLRYLYNKPDFMQDCNEIEKHCKLDRTTAQNIYKKLVVDNFLKISKDTYEKGIEKVYLKDEGRAFIATSSYTKLNRREMPARLWWVAAIFAVITFTLPLYLQYCTKPNQEKSQVAQKEQLQPSPHKLK